MRQYGWLTRSAALIILVVVSRAPAQSSNSCLVTYFTDTVPPLTEVPVGPPSSPAPDRPLPVAVPIDSPSGGPTAPLLTEKHAEELSPASAAGAFAFWGEYLLLKAHRNDQEFATLSPNRIELPGGTIQSLDWQTQSGFRVGGGYQLPGDGVLLGVTYTYFHTNDNRTVGVPNGGLLFATLTRGGSFDDVSTATGLTNLDYHVLDLDVSKRFSPTHGFDLMIFGGGRLAEIDQKLEAIYNGGTMAAVNNHVSAPVHFSGGGLTVGGEAVWRLYEARGHTGVGLFARARGSLLTGEFRNSLTETTNNGSVVIVDVSEKTHAIVPVAELAVGLSLDWEHLSLRAGYEISNWFNMVNSPDYPDAANIGKLVRRQSDLSLEGLSVRLGLSF